MSSAALRLPERRGSDEPLVSSGKLGELERVLRTYGPLSADKLAARLHCRRATVRELLDRHPLCFHNAHPRRASRWALAKVGSDLAPVTWRKSDLSEPMPARVLVTCPVCGAQHEIPGGHARKIAKRARSAKCPECARERRRLPTRPVLSERERQAYGSWWLEQFSDEEIAAMAHELGVENASAEMVAAWRRRLLAG